MSEQNIALIEEVAKLLGDTYAGQLAKTVADLLRLERKAERERIIALLKATDELKTIEGGELVNYAETAIALIKGDVADQNYVEGKTL